MKTILGLTLLSLITPHSLFAAELTCDEWIKQLKAKTQSSRELELAFAQLPDIQNLCSNPTQAEKDIFDALWSLEKQKKLDSAILLTIKKLNAKNEKLIAAAPMISGGVRSEFYDRGYYNSKVSFVGWNTLAKNQEEHLKRLPRISSFKSETFKQVFKTIGNSNFTKINNFKILDNNGLAYQTRIQLIKNAKSSIKLLSWSFHDDSAANAIYSELNRAMNRNVKVQIIVDGIIAGQLGNHANLEKLKRLGAEIIYWKSSSNPFFGMHSKMLIVDDQYSIDGGRNIGSKYLENGKWSDFDVYSDGPLTELMSTHIFAAFWNEQIELQRLSFDKIISKSINNLPSGDTGTFISVPQARQTDAVSNLTVYSIMNTKREIEISNAYFIATPGIQKALKDAIKRGVKVRIFSNSMASVDEPLVSIPIQKSLNDMFKAGAEVYTKIGQTHHSKFFIADDVVWFGSYNLHPRSGRYEYEKVTVSTNPELVTKISQSFKTSLREAKRISNIKDLEYPNHPAYEIIFGIIYNQL